MVKLSLNEAYSTLCVFVQQLNHTLLSKVPGLYAQQNVANRAYPKVFYVFFLCLYVNPLLTLSWFYRPRS